MKSRMKWGLAILIGLLIGVSVFTLTRTPETEPEEVYRAPTPAEKSEVDRNIQDAIDKAKKDLPRNAEVEHQEVSHENSQAKTVHTPSTEQTVMPLATDEVRVSKFGFGPYPELPADFPWQDLFDYPYYTEDPNDEYKDDPDYELMHRVRVELWKRGEKVLGMSTSRRTGLFYPTIPGTIYVEWGPRWKIFGQEIGRKIRSVKGDPDDLKSLRAMREEDGRPLLESDIPSHLKVLDISEGIDPYDFLDLPK